MDRTATVWLDPSSNHHIETDRHQRRFATLAPSAHAGRYVF
jgi:hypothetical protein